MKRLLAKVVCNGEYQVIYDDTQKTNPYRLYHNCRVYTDHGVRMSKQQVQRYQDFGSAMYYIADQVRRCQ